MTDPGHRRTTVVLDTQSLSSVAAGSGTGSYTKNLLEGLAARSDIEVVALCEPGLTLPDGVGRLPIRRRSRRPRAKLIENSLRIGLELRRGRPDGSVFHNPAFHAPPGLGAPWVQTLHDVIPLRFDAPDLAALRTRWKRFGPRYRAAAAVIAISRHTADEGIRMLGLDPGRVHVALHGVDPVYRPGAGPTDPPYLLVVSEFSRRKGFAEAFAVMDQLVDAGYPHRLVVVGQVHDWGRHELAALHRAARHPERIELRGFVPDLVPLYQGATGFLMTSHYEGFGFPPLEAMACGVPVVAFSNSAVTEVVGAGGVLVPDGDVPAMAVALRALLDDPARADERRAQGREHAASFTWSRSVDLHAEIYRSVAEQAS